MRARPLQWLVMLPQVIKLHLVKMMIDPDPNDQPN
jgi:hypothetical protein